MMQEPQKNNQSLREYYDSRKADKTIQEAYSIFSPWNLRVIHERQLKLQELLKIIMRSDPLSGKKCLDVGCGNGRLINDLISFGWPAEKITGLDLFPERIGEARKLTPASVQFVCGDFLETLSNQKFSAVFMYTVLSSIPNNEDRGKFLERAKSCLENGGYLVVYDFDRSLSFKKGGFLATISTEQILRLTGFEIEKKWRLTPHFFLGHRLTKIFPFLAPCLFWFPFIKTHYLAIFRKPVKS